MALPDVVVVVFYKGPNERTFSAIARVHVHATGIDGGGIRASKH